MAVSGCELIWRVDTLLNEIPGVSHTLSLNSIRYSDHTKSSADLESSPYATRSRRGSIHNCSQPSAPIAGGRSAGAHRSRFHRRDRWPRAVGRDHPIAYIAAQPYRRGRSRPQSCEGSADLVTATRKTSSARVSTSRRPRRIGIRSAKGAARRPRSMRFSEQTALAASEGSMDVLLKHNDASISAYANILILITLPVSPALNDASPTRGPCLPDRPGEQYLQPPLPHDDCEPAVWRRRRAAPPEGTAPSGVAVERTI